MGDWSPFFGVSLPLPGVLGNPANVSCVVSYEAPETDCAGAHETASPTDDSVTVLLRLPTYHEPAVVDKLSFRNKPADLVTLAFELSF